MSSELSPEDLLFLRERYGNTANKKASWWLPALLFAVIGGGWLIWSASHAALPEMRSTLLSFDSTSPQLMHIRYQVEIKQTSQQHQCTLIARDVDKNTVGQITDLLPIGVSKIGRDIAIPTRLQAVNAAIASCK